MTGLGISVGILGIGCIVFSIGMYKWKKKIKAKLSDENLCKVQYNPSLESIRILEGVNPLEELQKRILISRLDLDLDEIVEDIGVSDQTVGKEITNEQEDDFYSIDESFMIEGENLQQRKKETEVIYVD